MMLVCAIQPQGLATMGSFAISYKARASASCHDLNINRSVSILITQKQYTGIFILCKFNIFRKSFAKT